MRLLDVRDDHLKIVQAILQKFVSKQDVWAFGSRAKWLAKEYSDLDLCIVGEAPLSFTTLGLLKEAFEESDLPYKVDVVDWGSTSESFRKIIERDKVVVQEGLSRGSEWHDQPLSDVIEIISGGTPKTSIPEYWKGDIPWLSVVDFNTGYRWVSHAEKRITELGLSKSPATLLCERDIIISARGTVGALAQLSMPMAFNQSCYGIRGIPRISDTDFIYYFLHKALAEMNQLAHGGVFNTITRDTFKLIKLSLPPLPEQRAIAHILGTLDDKIELNRKQNETLEAMARALFKAWFVDFEPVRAKLEGRWRRGESLLGLPAHLYDLFPDRLVESELGEIPKGWKIGMLGNVFLLRNERTQPSETVSSLPYVPIECINAKNPFLSEWISGSEAKSSLTLFKRGDILFGAMRPYFHKVCIAPFDGVTRTTVFTLKVNIPESSAYALMLAFQPETVEYATLHSEGSTIPYAKWKDSFEKMPMVLPPKILQTRFTELISPYIQQANASIQQSRSLAQLRDTLLPKLISGELRIKDAAAFLQERGL